jgi:hypothetical protein
MEMHKKETNITCRNYFIVKRSKKVAAFEMCPYSLNIAAVRGGNPGDGVYLWNLEKHSINGLF